MRAAAGLAAAALLLVAGVSATRKRVEEFHVGNHYQHSDHSNGFSALQLNDAGEWVSTTSDSKSDSPLWTTLSHSDDEFIDTGVLASCHHFIDISSVAGAWSTSGGIKIIREEGQLHAEYTRHFAVYKDGVLATGNYAAHVYSGVCDTTTRGGGHWLIDDAQPDSAANGVWAPFTVPFNANAYTPSLSTGNLDEDAITFVIHSLADAGDKVLCCTLKDGESGLPRQHDGDGHGHFPHGHYGLPDNARHREYARPWKIVFDNIEDNNNAGDHLENGQVPYDGNAAATPGTTVQFIINGEEGAYNHRFRTLKIHVSHFINAVVDGAYGNTIDPAQFVANWATLFSEEEPPRAVISGGAGGRPIILKLWEAPELVLDHYLVFRRVEFNAEPYSFAMLEDGSVSLRRPIFGPLGDEEENFEEYYAHHHYAEVPLLTLKYVSVIFDAVDCRDSPLCQVYNPDI